MFGLLFLAIGSLFLLCRLLLGFLHLFGHLLHLADLASVALLLGLFALLVLAALGLALALVLLLAALFGRLLDLLGRLLRGFLGLLEGLVDDFIIGLDSVLDLREGTLSCILLLSLAQG